jgi:GH15 family glucan-1,4-alpha-glucosidase
VYPNRDESDRGLRHHRRLPLRGPGLPDRVDRLALLAAFRQSAIFGALLDERAGRWALARAVSFRSQRRYVGDTNVLETRFQTDTGSATLTDLMPVSLEEDKRNFLAADHEILRILECDEGKLEIELVFEPRARYGLEQPRFRSAGQLGLRVETSAGLLVLRTDMPLAAARDGRVRSRVRLHAGDAFHFSLTFADDWQAILPPVGAWSREMLARSLAWWRNWIARLSYDGARHLRTGCGRRKRALVGCAALPLSSRCL